MLFVIKFWHNYCIVGTFKIAKYLQLMKFKIICYSITYTL